MTTTFDNVTLYHASKLSEEPAIAISDTLLLSGYHSIQSNTNYGFGATYSCLCTWDQYETIRNKIGASGSLVTSAGETYTCCHISSLRVQETDSPWYYRVEVGFKQGVS